MSDNFYKINRGINLGPQAGEPSNPSNGDIYYDTSLNKFRKYENGSWSDLGSSNSAGNKNFITNGDAEANTLGWSTYADAAGTRPVDGTGGSPTVTFTRSTSSPLEGLGSFLFTKDAANRQGQGVSYDFTIDQAYKAKVLSIELDYQVVSGTFAAGSSSTDSDLIVYLYDVTNSTLIEPSSFKLLSNSTTFTDRFKSTFQTSATGTQYRLIVHCATTSASSYVVKFDNIKVSPSEYIFGTPSADFGTQAWTVTNASANSSFRVTREGRRVYIDGTITFTGAATGQIGLTIPTAYAADMTVYDTASVSVPVGLTRFLDVSPGSVYDSLLQLNTATSITTAAEVTSGAHLGPQGTSATVPHTWASGDKIYVQASWIVAGWAASTQMSDKTDTRVVAFKARRGTDQTGVNTNNTEVKMTLNQTISDTHGAFNTTTNQYIVPVAGYYVFTGSVQPLNTNILAARYQLRIYKNNSSLNFSHNPVHNANVGETLHCTTAPEYCVQGDVIELRYFGAGNNSVSTITLNSDSTVTFLSGMMVSGPQAIAASESVSARYTSSAGQSIANGAQPIIDFATKYRDSHNSVTTGANWKFTAPISGNYLVTTLVSFATANFTSTTATNIKLFKNAVEHSNIAQTPVQVTASINTLTNAGSDTVYLNAGDFIDLRVAHGEATARSLTTDPARVHISIDRVGN